MGFAVRIFKDIPFPGTRPRGREGTRKPKYPWAIMEVDDRFLWPGSPRNAYAAVLQANRFNHPKKFAAAFLDGGMWVWRIA